MSAKTSSTPMPDPALSSSASTTTPPASNGSSLRCAASPAPGPPAVVFNARQVRDFAKGTGQLAKTDQIDAGILAHFGEVVATVVRPLPTREIQEFRDLCDQIGRAHV